MSKIEIPGRKAANLMMQMLLMPLLASLLFWWLFPTIEHAWVYLFPVTLLTTGYVILHFLFEEYRKQGTVYPYGQDLLKARSYGLLWVVTLGAFAGILLPVPLWTRIAIHTVAFIGLWAVMNIAMDYQAYASKAHTRCNRLYELLEEKSSKVLKTPAQVTNENDLGTLEDGTLLLYYYKPQGLSQELAIYWVAVLPDRTRKPYLLYASDGDPLLLAPWSKLRGKFYSSPSLEEIRFYLWAKLMSFSKL